MAEKTLVDQLYTKNEENGLEGPYKIGASFEDIVDSRQGKDPYSLAQFFDNYMSFMKNTTFVYTGVDKPANDHIGIWIDTSMTNADQIGQTVAANAE